jgi:hypothetical protein
MVRKLSAFLALIVLLGQLSIILHEVADPHDVGAACEVCIIQDRLANASGSSSATFAFIAIALSVFLFIAAPVLARPVLIALPRGPPTL